MYKELIGKEYYYQSFSERNGVKISKSKIVDIVISYLADNIRVFTDEDSWGTDYKLSTFNVESVFKFEPNFTELETYKCIQSYYNNLRGNVEDNIKLRKLYISEHKDNIRAIKESIVEIEEKLNQYKKDLENINQLEKELLNVKAN